MSPKRRVSEAPAAQTDRFIRSAAIIVIALVIGVLVWNRLPESEMSLDAACAMFDSIPAEAQYQAPPLLTDSSARYSAHIEMEKGGEITLELYPEQAPVTVNSFIFLACKGFYDGVTFHRVIDGFMAQSGDPTGSGSGGPGYQFKNEDSDLVFDKAGVLAMANSGRDTNGSQFFVTFGPSESLNGGYTIFGQLVAGMDVLNALTRRDPLQAPSYEGDRIASITITLEK